MGWVLLVMGLSGALLAPLYALLVALGKAPGPASAGWLLLTGAAVLTGLSGVLVTAPATQVELAQAVAVALANHTAISLMLAGSFLAVAAVASLTSLLSPGPDAGFEARTFGAAIAGMALGGVISGLVLAYTGADFLLAAGPAAYLVPVLSLSCTVGLLLACLRDSAEDVHRARIAGWRALFGISCFMGCMMIGELFVSMGLTLAFQAVANASVDMKNSMLANGIEVASRARVVGLLAGLPMLLAGLGAALPAWGTLSRANAIGAVSAGLQVLLILIGLVFGVTPVLGLLVS